MATGNQPNVSVRFKTSLIPKISGGWWAPSYYILILTIIAVFVNFTVKSIKSKGKSMLKNTLITILLLYLTYTSTRSSTCLWSGGCRILSVFSLLTPILMLIVVILNDISEMSSGMTLVDLSKFKNISMPNMDAIPAETSKDSDESDESEDVEEEVEESYVNYGNKYCPY